jgi:hypothetical protein
MATVVAQVPAVRGEKHGHCCGSSSNSQVRGMATVVAQVPTVRGERHDHCCGSSSCSQR